jgi:hypothetical protein
VNPDVHENEDLRRRKVRVYSRSTSHWLFSDPSSRIHSSHLAESFLSNVKNDNANSDQLDRIEIFMLKFSGVKEEEGALNS